MSPIRPQLPCAASAPDDEFDHFVEVFDMLAAIDAIVEAIGHLNDAGWWGAGAARRRRSISILLFQLIAVSLRSSMSKAHMRRERRPEHSLIRRLVEPPVHWASA